MSKTPPTNSNWRLRLIFFLGEDATFNATPLKDSVCLGVDTMERNGPEVFIYLKPEHLPELRKTVEALEALAAGESVKEDAEPCRSGATK